VAVAVAHRDCGRVEVFEKGLRVLAAGAELRPQLGQREFAPPPRQLDRARAKRLERRPREVDRGPEANSQAQIDELTEKALDLGGRDAQHLRDRRRRSRGRSVCFEEGEHDHGATTRLPGCLLRADSGISASASWCGAAAAAGRRRRGFGPRPSAADRVGPADRANYHAIAGSRDEDILEAQLGEPVAELDHARRNVARAVMNLHPLAAKRLGSPLEPQLDVER